jgi:hypothetical protein
MEKMGNSYRILVIKRYRSSRVRGLGKMKGLVFDFGLDLTGLIYGLVVRFCEHDDEFFKGRE